MKFSDIIKTFKKSTNIQIFENSKKPKSEQWLSNGCAAYALENMPRFTSETLPAAASLTWSADLIKAVPFPPDINFDNNDETENPIERSPIAFNGIVPFFTQEGITLINAKHLIPFRNENPEDISFYERISQNGELYIAVKRGYFCIAVILPLGNIDSTIAEYIEEAQSLLNAMERYQRRQSDKRREMFYKMSDIEENNSKS